jgi:sulfatase modifying factor 1
MTLRVVFVAVVAELGLLGSSVLAINIETVPVGNPGNADDTHGDGYGGVDYVYNIGKFEVTAGQYTEFLNAVATTDTYGLYFRAMDSLTGIWRSGSAGSYTYSVDPDWANRPVNYVDWGDAARFCNWLENGQPTGAQDLTTTEDGSYYLNGATSIPALQAVTRKKGAVWVIPTEDEWYKAAYYDGPNAVYYDFPTGTDATPSNDLIEPDPGNNANFLIDPNDYTIGSPYSRTVVGEFENSESPYGTFDQGGNVWEWNEAIVYNGTSRSERGGGFYNGVGGLRSAVSGYSNPANVANGTGFRVALVPEPATLSILVFGCLTLLRRRRG